MKITKSKIRRINLAFIVVSICSILFVYGCGKNISSETTKTKINYFLVLDQTLSLDTLDLNDYPSVIDALLKQVSVERGDQFAVAFIHNNSLDQREIRFGLKPLKNSRDLPTKKANDRNFKKFRESIKNGVAASRKSTRSDIYGALSLAGLYFSAFQDTTLENHLIVVSDGLHNLPDKRIIASSLTNVSVLWVGLNAARFSSLSQEYKEKIEKSGSKSVRILGRSGLSSLINGQMKIG